MIILKRISTANYDGKVKIVSFRKEVRFVPSFIITTATSTSTESVEVPYEDTGSAPYFITAWLSNRIKFPRTCVFYEKEVGFLFRSSTMYSCLL